jgi:2',3'-cyclic-nucleotide 2'-phosphodiesterase (5'-nucleotidase family)
VLESNLDGVPVLINQTGWAGINLGRIDIDFDQKLVKGNTIKVE